MIRNQAHTFFFVLYSAPKNGYRIPSLMVMKKEYKRKREDASKIACLSLFLVPLTGFLN
jgi:hypothetical protein